MKGTMNQMRKILVTGGTTFVSRYAAGYFVSKGDQVYVLNRNTKQQEKGVILIEADRHNLKDELKDIRFDVVIDVTAYNERDICDLQDALGEYNKYIMISSGAVYAETSEQPFTENSRVGKNIFVGDYGTNKIEAEKCLLEKDAMAYIIRPPYLYGPMNNVYREAFVFECAQLGRPFYIPKNGEMKLQFFHVKDLCRVIESIMITSPKEHIMNVGNSKPISIKEWVALCYRCVGKEPDFRYVDGKIEQRNYFSFDDYEYFLNVDIQNKLIGSTLPLETGLKEAYEWYCENSKDVKKKDFMEYIDKNLA